MSNYEKITASPEALAEFLASLSVEIGPWDEKFHARFCAGCAATCDVCPHAEERNNPLWWLTKAAEGERETAERPANIVVWKNGQVVLEPGTVNKNSRLLLDVVYPGPGETSKKHCRVGH